TVGGEGGGPDCSGVAAAGRAGAGGGAGEGACAAGGVGAVRLPRLRHRRRMARRLRACPPRPRRGYGGERWRVRRWPIARRGIRRPHERRGRAEMSRRAVVLAKLGDAELRALRGQVGEQVRAEIDQILEERGRKKRKRRPAKPPEKEGPANGYALVVPWDCLASKNLLLKGGGERKPAEMEYRAAIRRTRAEVGRQVPEPHPAYHGPVAAGFVFYPPDDRSDIHNFFDAL